MLIGENRNTFLGAIRTKSSLPPSILETVICRVAVLNRAWFEWEQHAPLLLAAADISTSSAYVCAVFSESPAFWKDSSVAPSQRHALALEFTDALTLGCETSDELITRMKKVFNEREIMEVTATCSAYNCVSRFLVALDVGESNGERGLKAAIEAIKCLAPDAKPASRTLVLI
jgi:alkylhydroperoxidase family enzyme